MTMTIHEHLEHLKKIKAEYETMTPEFKPQYGNKYKTQTMREIAEHSNFFKIEIHPNIVDELIVKERLERANKFVNSRLATLSADELANVQIEIQHMMIQQEIDMVEAKINADTPAVNPADYDPQVTAKSIPVTNESANSMVSPKKKTSKK